MFLLQASPAGPLTFLYPMWYSAISLRQMRHAVMHHYRQIKSMLTVREHMGSHPGVGGVRISHLCRFLSRACVCEYVCVCVCWCVCGGGKGVVFVLFPLLSVSLSTYMNLFLLKTIDFYFMLNLCVFVSPNNVFVLVVLICAYFTFI